MKYNDITNSNDTDIDNNTFIDDEFQAEDVFAGTFNIVKNNVFYGRYWGCLPGYESKNLHFEVCYWSAIEYCITHNIERMEPGAGGGGEFLFFAFFIGT